ncbi:hypothetical protein ACXZ1K_10695 [Pedobacter sp. PWIIR3]
MDQFKIQIEKDNQICDFDVKQIERQWYEISDLSGMLIGKIKIDHENHEHCEYEECVLDLPIMSAIREQIYIHKIFNKEDIG